MTAYEQIEALAETLEDAAECHGIDRDGATREEMRASTAYLDAARAALLAAVKALAEDAERYRWLRECPPKTGWPSIHLRCYDGYHSHITGHTADSAIDAARQSTTSAADNGTVP